jgi:hypothetical protein
MGGIRTLVTHGRACLRDSHSALAEALTHVRILPGSLYHANCPQSTEL